jgi:hypothetical protein
VTMLTGFVWLRIGRSSGLLCEHGSEHVKILGFGTVCICRYMPTFRRNMLSPSSGAEVTRPYRLIINNI